MFGKRFGLQQFWKNQLDRLRISYTKQDTLVSDLVPSSLYSDGIICWFTLEAHWPIWCRLNSSSGQSLLVAWPWDTLPVIEYFLKACLASFYGVLKANAEQLISSIFAAIFNVFEDLLHLLTEHHQLLPSFLTGHVFRTWHYFHCSVAGQHMFQSVVPKLGCCIEFEIFPAPSGITSHV